MIKSLSILFLFFFSFGFAQHKFDISAVQEFQKKMNNEYANPKESPLRAEDLAKFKGLDFFPINQKAFVIAKFVRTKKEKPFEMKTSTSRKPIYIKYGEITFIMDGKEFKLNLYQDIELSKKAAFKDDLFLPFSDLTSGKESYIGGRYIDLIIPKGKTIAVDFNLAYNPYCAYNYKYSCPLVPLENDLDVEIKAGVKKFDH
tara:strand:+ start:599 stop:1201 length:603 start_codon:yes stop_codon:yes gene_type:complete